ncbi:AAA family ATPase [Tetragenococcus solitarius]|uniref:AAA family ATPase n=1 Tax=Tetragenococcus solitarius TaxID=71453 RepID=A0ABN3YD81_9ENTE|nr:AAA family ATPase [Tetragenococcus solitarius]
MIIWINGAFGSGKTTIAKLLNAQIDNSFLYDPENIGDFLRNNLPQSIQKRDFQYYREWREWNVHLLKKMFNEYNGDIIAPMTLYKKEAFDGIIGELRRLEVPICHIQLEVSKNTILERLEERNPSLKAWGTERVDEILESFKKIPASEKINNDDVAKEDTVSNILDRIKR